jgi:hypothetical protein
MSATNQLSLLLIPASFPLASTPVKQTVLPIFS